MADENQKPDKGIAESIVDDVSSSLEASAGEGGQKSQDVHQENPAGASDSQYPKWVTSLPTEFREEARDCANLTEYLKKLKEGVGAKGAEETDEDWDRFYQSIGAEDGASERMIAQAMRENGADTKMAGAVYMSIQSKIASDIAERESSKRQMVDSLFAENRKKDKAFDAVITNGMKSFAQQNPEMFRRARDTGLATDPAFIMAFYSIGKMNTEVPPAGSSTKGSKPSGFDPMNPLGY